MNTIVGSLLLPRLFAVFPFHLSVGVTPLGTTKFSFQRLDDERERQARHFPCFLQYPEYRLFERKRGKQWRGGQTDFSFFLAIPTLIGAGVYSLYKERALLSMADLPMFAVGLVVSFISAWLCVRWLLKFISTHSFVGFAYYRIVFGVVVLATAWSGLVVWAP